MRTQSPLAHDGSEQQRCQPMPTARRLLLLIACAAAGIGIGVAGSMWSGSQAWYLAVPLVMALGWVFVADPSRCSGEARDNSGRAR